MTKEKFLEQQKRKLLESTFEMYIQYGALLEELCSLLLDIENNVDHDLGHLEKFMDEHKFMRLSWLKKFIEERQEEGYEEYRHSLDWIADQLYDVKIAEYKYHTA